MQKVLSKMRKAIEKYHLINDGDKIAVGLSGGKDSMVLLKALADFKKFGLYNYDLIAITIDNYSGEMDYSGLKEYCQSLNVELHIIQTDIAKVVFDLRKESNPCSLCAKMRRGALCEACLNLGFNKLALAHHLQDVVTTFFMSLFYEGRLSTIMPKSYMSNTQITLIRPLFLTEEKIIKNASKDMPILKNKCPADKNSSRKDVKDLIENIEKEIPGCRVRIENAILNPERYHLLDKIEN